MDNIGKKFTPNQGRIRALDVYSRDTISKIFISYEKTSFKSSLLEVK